MSQISLVLQTLPAGDGSLLLPAFSGRRALLYLWASWRSCCRNSRRTLHLIADGCAVFTIYSSAVFFRLSAQFRSTVFCPLVNFTHESFGRQHIIPAIPLARHESSRSVLEQHCSSRDLRDGGDIPGSIRQIVWRVTPQLRTNRIWSSNESP